MGDGQRGFGSQNTGLPHEGSRVLREGGRGHSMAIWARRKGNFFSPPGVARRLSPKNSGRFTSDLSITLSKPVPKCEEGPRRVLRSELCRESFRPKSDPLPFLRIKRPPFLFPRALGSLEEHQTSSRSEDLPRPAVKQNFSSVFPASPIPSPRSPPLVLASQKPPHSPRKRRHRACPGSGPASRFPPLLLLSGV